MGEGSRKRPGQVVTRGISTQPESETEIGGRMKAPMRSVDQRDNKLASVTQVEQVLAQEGDGRRGSENLMILVV